MVGESRLDTSANSRICNLSSRRWIEVSTMGTASEMNPGLLPVLWMEVAPRSHAASTRLRIAGSMLSGWWNSPQVATTFTPDSSKVGPIPHRSPASRPSFSAVVTYRPARVSCGCSITPRSERVPILPVAHWTTR